MGRFKPDLGLKTQIEPIQWVRSYMYTITTGPLAYWWIRAEPLTRAVFIEVD